MTLDPNAQLDPSQITDVRGRGFPGGGRGLAAGGGGIVVVIAALAIALLGGDPSVLLGGAGADSAPIGDVS